MNNSVTPHPLPVRIMANAIVAPLALITSPVWLPIALFFEKKRNQA